MQYIRKQLLVTTYQNREKINDYESIKQVAGDKL